MVCGQKFLARPGLKTCSGTGSGIIPGRLLDDERYGGGGTVQRAEDDGQSPRLELLLQPGLRIGSGSRRAKMTLKSRNFFKSSCSEVLDGLF